MQTIKLLLAHSDRRVTNQVEVAILDVCYDLAVVQPTRTARLDEFVRQGALWEFDLIVMGAEGLFLDRTQQILASAEDVAQAIRTIRSKSSTPIIVLALNRSEEHTSELQSHSDLVCRLLLEKKKNNVGWHGV